MRPWEKIGEILVARFAVSQEQVDAALVVQKETSQRLGDILKSQEAIDDLILGQALAHQFNLPFIAQLGDQQSEPGLLSLIPIGFAKQYLIFPLGRDETTLHVAVADPCDNNPLNDLSTLTGLSVDASVAPTQEILHAINRAYESQAGETDNVIEEIESNAAGEAISDLEPADLLDSTDEAPIIRFVNSLLTQGFKERASDIHIEPFESELIIRYRIDGILYDVHKPPLKAHAGIVSRIKIMAQLNIAEKRLPQDGRFRVRVGGKDVDIRVSTLPTVFGERIVLRILDKAAGILSLEKIGLGEEMMKQLDAMITKSHGIFLVTGPTGSGKTTSLYAALTRLNSRESNIITVEDPIEYQLQGVGQIQVNPKIDLTFANGLRSILRQDPDIIMVGEIRDQETAAIAVQSALTGHMVFSTLHTNDAAGALTRLVEMGVEPFLVASGIVGILAQRLVRTICPHCRVEHHPPVELLADISAELTLPETATFYRGEGCDQCMQIGYWGRTGIYELLQIDERVRELLMQGMDAATIKRAAMEGNMRSLRATGVEKALQGITSLEEVMRVTQEDV